MFQTAVKHIKSIFPWRGLDALKCCGVEDPSYSLKSKVGKTKILPMRGSEWRIFGIGLLGIMNSHTFKIYSV